MGACLAFVFGLLALPVPAHAYTPESLAQYQAAKKFQAARQWRRAALAYEAALAADPGLVAANKDLGAVYREMGDHVRALHYYDRYLAAYPGDSATRTVAESLRVADEVTLPPVSTPAQVTAGLSPPSGPFNPGFDIRGSAMGVMASGADVAEFYDWYSPSIYTGSTYSGPGSVVAQGYEVGGDYGFSNGFVYGLDLLYGPLRTDQATLVFPDGSGGTVTEKDTYNIDQFAVMITPGWRFRLGKSLVVEPRLGLGIMNATWVYTQNYTFDSAAVANGDPAYYTKTTYDATSGLNPGYAIWPELRAEYLFGRFGLGLSVGYLLNTNTELRYGSSAPGTAIGNPVGYDPSPTATQASLWYLNTSGFSASIYCVWHFQPLFRD